jgi:hypothetical protein
MSAGGQKVLDATVGEEYPLKNGPLILLAAVYVFGCLLGLLFIGLWVAKLAEIGLAGAGVAITGLCLYLLPETLAPLTKGEKLVFGGDRFQLVRGAEIVGQVPYAHIASVTLNGADGGNSVWVELDDRTASEVVWPGGTSQMEIIHSQCGHDLVVGKGFKIPPKDLLNLLTERMPTAH